MLADFNSLVVLLKPSKARMDLLNQFEIVNREDEDLTSVDSESEAAIFEIQDLRRSISTTSFTSVQMSSQVKNTSTTNLLIAPSVSACSALETPRFVALNEMEPVLFKPSIFKFTREDLQIRLQNLVVKSIKNFSGDFEVKAFNLNP